MARSSRLATAARAAGRVVSGRPAARPVLSRRAPPATAGALGLLGNIGGELRRRVDAGHGISATDCVVLLGHLRDLYRVVRAIRPDS